jgi:hypothetical protein
VELMTLGQVIERVRRRERFVAGEVQARTAVSVGVCRMIGAGDVLRWRLRRAMIHLIR